MFKEVIFYNLDEMRAARASPDAVVISILDRMEEPRRPTLTGYRDVLKLHFEDTHEEEKLAHPGDWAEEPSDEEHARFAKRKGERIFTMTDAREILKFLALHHSTFENLTLIVHCYGGISRSAAVAKWASVKYWAPITGKRTPVYPNPRVLRLLDKAALEP